MAMVVVGDVCVHIYEVSWPYSMSAYYRLRNSDDLPEAICSCQKRKRKMLKVQNPRHKMQVALLAEPKTPLCLYNTMSTSKEMWWP